MLSNTQTPVSLSVYFGPVKTINNRTIATNNFDKGSRYFSSKVDAADACVTDEASEPDFDTDVAT